MATILQNCSVNSNSTLCTVLTETLTRLINQIAERLLWPCILGILGVIINVFVIVVLIRKGTLHTKVRVHVSLCLCDILLSAASPVLYVLPNHLIRKYLFYCSLRVDDKLSTAVIRGVNLIGQTVQFVVFITLVFLALDLLIMIKYPFRHAKFMTKRTETCIVVCVWIFAALLNITGGILDEFYTCFSQWLYLRVHLVTIPVCLLAMLIIYCLVVYEVRKFALRIPTQREIKLKKSVVTSVLIVALFGVCLLPPYALFVIKINLETTADFMIATQCLYTAHSVCNPVIYIVRLPEARYQIVRFIEGTKRCFHCFRN